jgi:hypothetical protein
MTIDIAFLESAPIQHRFKDGKIWDVIDYPFRISDGRATHIVNVGITGQFQDPAEALGSKGLTKGELVEAARTWLRSRIDKGNCDPNSRLDLISSAMAICESPIPQDQGCLAAALTLAK